ncbi:MAG: DUF3291 domain-containing protein [Phenylobacterium sp.]
MLHHLAQINIARFRLPMDHPANSDFIGNLDPVNGIAEAQPGFVWRLTGDGNNALDLRAYDDPNVAVNMSVWTDLDALATFVYRSEAHRGIMRRRREWFDPIETHMALWWIPAGHRPKVTEGVARLERLRQLGPTQDAFSFKHPFPPPGFLDDRPDP